MLFYASLGRPSTWSDLTSVISYNLKLQLSSSSQLHYARPVIFDYLHLSAIEIVAHSMLVGICQPAIM